MIRPTSLSGFTPAPAAPTRPAAEVGGPRDVAELRGTGRAEVVVPFGTPVAAVSAAGVGGPLGLSLAERMSALPVQWVLKRKWRLPFLSPTVEVEPRKAARHLEKGGDRLSVRLKPDDKTLQPIGPKEVLLLEVMHRDGPTEGLDRPELAETLKSLQKQGLRFSLDGFPAEGFTAYHKLCEGKTRVEVRRGELLLGHAGSLHLESALERESELRGDPMALLGHLGGIFPDDPKRVALEAKRFAAAEQPELAPLAEALAGFSDKTSQAALERLEKLGERLTQGSFSERIGFLTELKLGGSDNPLAQLACSTYDRLRRAGHGADTAREACAAAHGWRDPHDYYGYSPSRAPLEHLGALAECSSEAIGYYARRLVERERPELAAAQARQIARDLPGTTFAEREQALQSHLKLAPPALEAGWDAIEAMLAAGRSLPEAAGAVSQLAQARRGDPSLPVLQQLKERPDRLEGLCALARAQAPVEAMPTLLDAVEALPGPPEPRLQVLGALGARCSARSGQAFLAALEAGGGRAEVADQLKALAGTGRDEMEVVGEYYRERLLGQAEATGVLGSLLSGRVPAKEAFGVLEQLQGWASPASLTDRLKSFQAVAGYTSSYSYGYEQAGQAGNRPTMARAMGTLLASGQDPEAHLRALWDRLSSRPGDYLRALEHVADQVGSDREATRFFCDAVHGLTHLDQAIALAERAGREIPGTTGAERFQACRDLGLTRRDGPPPLETYAALEQHLAAGVSLKQGVERLKPLTGCLGSLREKDAALETFGGLALDPAAQDALLALFRGQVQAAPARAAVEKLQGRPEQAAVAGVLARLGSNLSTEATEVVVEATLAGGATALANLERFTAACHGRRPLGQPLAELYARDLASSPELCELMSLLIEAKPREGDLLPLFERMRQPAGTSTPAQRCQEFNRIGGFRPGDTYYGERGLEGALQLELYHAGASLVAAGHDMSDAQQLWHRLGFGNRASAAILRYFGDQVAACPAAERKLFVELANQHITETDLGQLWESAHRPCAGTSFEERQKALASFSSREPRVRLSMMGLYRADLEAGRAEPEARQRVLAMAEHLQSHSGEEAVLGYEYAASLVGDAEAWSAFLDLIGHQVRPTVARQSVESNRAARDFQALEALRGLGKGGGALDPAAARALHDELGARLAEGRPREALLKTLGQLSQVAGERRFGAGEAAEAARHWGEHLAENEEGTACFCKLLGWKLSPAEAGPLESVLRQPTAGVSQSEKLAALEKPFTAAGDYYSHQYGKLLHSQPERMGMATALHSLLLAGEGLQPAGAAIGQVLIGSRSGAERVASLAVLERTAGLPEQRGFFLKLLRQSYEPAEAEKILEALARGGSFADRAAVYERLGLDRSRDYALNREAIALLDHEVVSGRTLEEASGVVGSALGGLKGLSAAEQPGVLGAYRQPPLAGEPGRRASFERLLLGGIPYRQALETVAEGSYAAHEEVVLALSPYRRNLTSELAGRVRQSVATQGAEAAPRLAGLAGVLAGRGAPLADVRAAFDYSDQGAQGRNPLLTELLALNGPVAEAPPLLEQLVKVGGKESVSDRLELVKGAVLGSWSEGMGPIAANLNRLYVSLTLVGRTPEEAADGVRRLGRRLAGSTQMRKEQADLFRRLEREPEKALAWVEILEKTYASDLLERFKTAPRELLERFPRVMQGGCNASQALEVLQIVNLPYGRSSREDRLAALDRLMEVNEQDQRTWFRKTLGAVMGSDQVSERQCLTSLVRIYGKLTEFGRTPAQAADLVSDIYQTEQARGVSHAALLERLAKLEEVAKLEIRTDNSSAILLDKDGKVVFSGVTIKKRAPRG